MQTRQTEIPSVVRIKPGALDRLGVYCRRQGLERATVFVSAGFDRALVQRLRQALTGEGVQIVWESEVTEITLETATDLAMRIPSATEVIVGFGGGKALDVAKYAAHLTGIAYFAVPASLSNDGFCSPQSSLTVAGKRRSLPSAMPFAVVIDTAVCQQAPRELWLSGVGDLVAKFTAVADWKLAFHAVQTPVDDFAALLSEASVYQFLAQPKRDVEGIRLLGTALLSNGVAMAMCGSSRPASGSEHLISHALDAISVRPRLHGLQVGVAAYLISLLQGEKSGVIESLFSATGFWEAVESDPFDRAEWREAVRLAPTLKSNFYTILSARDCLPEVEHLLREDPWLLRCVRE